MRRPDARRVGVVLVATACAALSAAPAASAQWTTAISVAGVSDTDSATEPQVDVDANGGAVAVWFHTTNPDADGIGTWQVRGAAIPVTATSWTGLPALSDPGARAFPPRTVAFRSNLALDVAAGGDAVAAWPQGTASTIQSARRPGGAAFGSVTSLGGFGCPNNSGLTDDNIVGPAVALDAAGKGHVAWNAPCGNTDNGRWMLFRQTTPDGFATTTKSAGHNNDDPVYGMVGPELAIDPSTGRTRMVFVEAEFPSPIVGRDLQDNDTVGPKDTVVSASSGGTVFQQKVGFLPDGKQVVVYRQSLTIYARIAGVETTLGPGQIPQLAVGKDGTVVAGWFNDGGFWAAVRDPVSGTWGPAHQLSPDEGEPRDLDIGVSDEGTGYAVWTRNAGEFTVLEAAILDPDDPTRSPGTPWQFQPVPTRIYDPATDKVNGSFAGGDISQAKIAVDPRGDATVLFSTIVELAPQFRREIASLRHLKPSPPPDEGGQEQPPAAGGQQPPPPGGAAPAGPGPAPPAPPAGDKRKPVVSAFSSLRDVFAKGSKEGKVVANRGDESATRAELRQPLRVGTRLSWTSDEPGRATITIAHTGCFATRYIGESVDRAEKCKAGGKPDGVVETIRKASKKGKTTVKWVGKTLPGKRLRVGGTYRATVTVTDAAGNVSPTRSVRLRIDEPAER